MQSKPGPGQQPQVFEVDAQATCSRPTLISADVVPTNPPLLARSDGGALAGGQGHRREGGRPAAAGQRPGDHQRRRSATTPGSRSRTYAGDRPARQRGHQVTFTPLCGALASNAQAADYVLLRARNRAAVELSRASCVNRSTHATRAPISRASARGARRWAAVALAR